MVAGQRRWRRERRRLTGSTWCRLQWGTSFESIILDRSFRATPLPRKQTIDGAKLGPGNELRIACRQSGPRDQYCIREPTPTVATTNGVTSQLLNPALLVYNKLLRPFSLASPSCCFLFLSLSAPAPISLALPLRRFEGWSSSALFTFSTTGHELIPRLPTKCLRSSQWSLLLRP